MSQKHIGLKLNFYLKMHEKKNKLLVGTNKVIIKHLVIIRSLNLFSGT